MPELPEVETTRCGLCPHVVGQPVLGWHFSNKALRWPVPRVALRLLEGCRVRALERRAKWLVWRFDAGCALTHLGMSGSLRVKGAGADVLTHTHIRLRFPDCEIHYHDPRRFGAWLWHPGQEVEQHERLRDLGPEPLSSLWSAERLRSTCRHSRRSIKQVIMDNKVVVGVGNIYACEALFRARLHPASCANQLSLADCHHLVQHIKSVLREAIETGGSTVRDYANADGRPGYFAQRLAVYGRAGLPCSVCRVEVQRITQSGRSTFFCGKCQRNL